MYKRGDFHLHTKASDGKLTPGELVNLAKKEGMDIIAVTDHDTVSGISEALKEGEKIGIKVIPGIELSTLHRNKTVHILGYLKSIEDITPDFEAYLKEMTEYRINRAEQIAENLQEIFNIKIDSAKMLKEANGIVARPHIAKAIVDAGYNYSWDYIFEKFIGEDSPAYVPNKKLKAIDGIRFLKSVNAFVSLAHPVLIKNLDMDELMELPFDGIEAIYSMNTPEDTEKFKGYAKKYNKVITAGSDFHGIAKEDSKHASTVGAVYLDEEGIQVFLDKLNCV